MTTQPAVSNVPPEIQAIVDQNMPRYGSNSVIVLAAPDGIRLVFTEVPEPNAKPRPLCSVDVAFDTAKSFASTLNQAVFTIMQQKTNR